MLLPLHQNLQAFVEVDPDEFEGPYNGRKPQDRLAQIKREDEEIMVLISAFMKIKSS